MTSPPVYARPCARTSIQRSGSRSYQPPSEGHRSSCAVNCGQDVQIGWLCEFRGSSRKSATSVPHIRNRSPLHIVWHHSHTVNLVSEPNAEELIGNSNGLMATTMTKWLIRQRYHSFFAGRQAVRFGAKLMAESERALYPRTHGSLRSRDRQPRRPPFRPGTGNSISPKTRPAPGRFLCFGDPL